MPQGNGGVALTDGVGYLPVVNHGNRLRKISGRQGVKHEKHQTCIAPSAWFFVGFGWIFGSRGRNAEAITIIWLGTHDSAGTGAHGTKMRSLQTDQEREAYRREHHKLMQERANERGVRLLDKPQTCSNGKGYGSGQGAGGRKRRY